MSPVHPHRRATLGRIAGGPALASVLSVGAAPPADASAEFRPGVRVVDVGQGAAMLVQGEGGHVLMIDSGPASGAEAIVHALALHGVRQVDLWVHSHFDADHVGGVGRVLQGADGRLGTADDIVVVEAWDRGDVDLPATDAVAVYFALVGEHRHAPAAEESWSRPGLRVRALRAVVDDAEGRPPAENQRALAVCVEVGSIRVLAAGDLPAAQVADAARQCGAVDLLWASHHGAENGISEQVLELAQPGAVAISAGRDNPHCHPSPRTLALLAGREVWATGAAGLWRDGPCGALVQDLDEHHLIEGGDLWFPADPQARSSLGPWGRHRAATGSRAGS